MMMKKIAEKIEKLSSICVYPNKMPLNGSLEIMEKRGFRGFSINDQKPCIYGKDCSYIAKNNPYKVL